MQLEVCGRLYSILDSHTTDLLLKSNGYLSTRLLTESIVVICSLHVVEVWKVISRFGETQDDKIGNCSFQCDAPHQWKAPKHYKHRKKNLNAISARSPYRNRPPPHETRL